MHSSPSVCRRVRPPPRLALYTFLSLFYNKLDSAIIATTALIKIIREGVALEDVYPNKAPGQKYGFDTFSGEMIAFDNYKELIGQ